MTEKESKIKDFFCQLYDMQKDTELAAELSSLMCFREDDVSLNVRQSEYRSAIIKAKDLIDSLDVQMQREVLTRRYLMHQKWELISERMDISTRHAIRLHDLALSVIAQKEIKG